MEASANVQSDETGNKSNTDPVILDNEQDFLPNDNNSIEENKDESDAQGANNSNQENLRDKFKTWYEDP